MDSDSEITRPYFVVKILEKNFSQSTESLVPNLTIATVIVSVQYRCPQAQTLLTQMSTRQEARLLDHPLYAY